jgi:hypothetical protein
MADTDNVLYAFLAFVIGGMVLFAVYKTQSKQTRDNFIQKKVRENLELRSESKDDRIEEMKELLMNANAEINRLTTVNLRMTAQLKTCEQGNTDMSNELFKAKKTTGKVVTQMNSRLATQNKQMKQMKETFKKTTLSNCPSATENFQVKEKMVTMADMRTEARLPMTQNPGSGAIGIGGGGRNRTTRPSPDEMLRTRLPITSTANSSTGVVSRSAISANQP